MRIPSKMYTRIRADKLGFATPADDQGFKKRKSTVDSWGGVNSDVLEFDNLPTNGFKIETNVSRGGGYFRTGNVVWEITDPRGFKFQISSSNMSAIIDECDIEKGVIKSDCVYARDGTSNALLPVDSKEYLECVEATRRTSRSVSKKSVKVGDTIRLKNDSQYVYLGYYNFITVRSVNSNNSSGDYNQIVEQIQRHVLIEKFGDDNLSSRYVFYADLKVSEIIESCDDPQRIADYTNKFFEKVYGNEVYISSVGHIYYIRCATTVPIDMSKYRIAKKKIDKSEFEKLFQIKDKPRHAMMYDDGTRTYYISSKIRSVFIDQISTMNNTIPTLRNSNGRSYDGNEVLIQIDAVYRHKDYTGNGKTFYVGNVGGFAAYNVTENGALNMVSSKQIETRRSSFYSSAVHMYAQDAISPGLKAVNSHYKTLLDGSTTFATQDDVNKRASDYIHEMYEALRQCDLSYWCVEVDNEISGKTHVSLF